MKLWRGGCALHGTSTHLRSRGKIKLLAGVVLMPFSLCERLHASTKHLGWGILSYEVSHEAIL